MTNAGTTAAGPSRGQTKLGLIAIVAAMVLIIGACGGGGTAAAEELQGVPATPESGVTETPQELADRLIVNQSEAPDGYVVIESEDNDNTVCDGVEEASVRFPTIAGRDVDVESAVHFFFAGVEVYASEGGAGDALEYLQEAYTVCNGKDHTDASGEIVQLTFAPLDPPFAAGDEAYGYASTATTSQLGMTVNQYFVRSGNVVLMAWGSDDATSLGLLDVMVAKLAGTDPPSVAAPAGGMTLLPGLDTVSDGTGSPSAGILRSAFTFFGDFSESAIAWIGAATDADIDDLAERACRSLARMSVTDDAGDTFEVPYSALSAEDQAVLDPASYRSVVGVSLLFYCPDFVERFNSVVDASIETEPSGLGELVRYDDPVDGFSILLPDGWILFEGDEVDIDQLLRGLSGTLFDAVRDQAAAALGQVGFRLHAMNVGSASQSGVVSITITAGAASPGDLGSNADEFRDLVVAGFGASNVETDPVLLDGRQALVITYDLAAMDRQSIIYMVRDADTTWVVNLAANDTGPLADDFHTIMESFRFTPKSPANDPDELAPGETPFIARHLVPVDGYSYVDAMELETGLLLDKLEAAEAEAGSDVWGGASLHSVIADDSSQNTTQGEVGFLYLIQFNEPISYGSEEEYARNSIEGELIDRLDIAGVRVFVFDNPQRPNSRYHYIWYEHGVGGTIDGADREPLETWVTAYLEVPKLGERETPELAARLRVVPGFAYFDVDPSAYAEELAMLGDIAYSIHGVIDSEDPIGQIILAETEDLAPLERVVDRFELDFVGDSDFGGHRVGTFERWGKVAFIWADAGFTGSLLTNLDDFDAAQRFLESVLGPAGSIALGDSSEDRASGELLSADFDAGNDRFHEDESGGYRYEIVDGTYRITLLTDGPLWPGSSVAPFSASTQSVHLSVSIAGVDADPDAVLVGIGCSGDDHYYEFLAGAGFYAFTPWEKGEGAVPIAQVIAPEYKVQAGDRLALICSYSPTDGVTSLSGMINGEVVISATDTGTRDFSGMDLVFFAMDAGASVQFDDVEAEIQGS